jgi:aryl-alcohol dehydrogenase-like predicted oxidoreductase
MVDAQAAKAVIARALDLGVTFFDTADIYGDSEAILGPALAAHRKQVVFATKFGMPGGELAGGGSRAYVMESAARSLRRLKTDYIDLLYFHVPDPKVPLEETLRALQDLVQQGKVRHAAVSNTSAAHLTEAAAVASAGHGAQFIAVQEQYNLLARQLERELLPVVEQQGIAVIPYYPLANGLLTGKYKRGVAPAKGTRFDVWQQWTSGLLTDANFTKIEHLEAFAVSRGHTIAELAIAWLLAQTLVPSVIAGATSAEQVEANVRGAAWHLSADELAQIDRLAPR